MAGKRKLRDRLVVLVAALGIAGIGVSLIFWRYDDSDLSSWLPPSGVDVDWGSHHALVGVFFIAISGYTFWLFFKGP